MPGVTEGEITPLLFPLLSFLVGTKGTALGLNLNFEVMDVLEQDNAAEFNDGVGVATVAGIAGGDTVLFCVKDGVDCELETVVDVLGGEYDGDIFELGCLYFAFEDGLGFVLETLEGVITRIGSGDCAVDDWVFVLAEVTTVDDGGTRLEFIVGFGCETVV